MGSQEDTEMNKRQTGGLYEAKAAAWLEEQGLVIVARNFRCRFGEIDLIARHQDYLVFVEVKYRKSAAAGHPAEAVTFAKQKTICKVAEYYCMMHDVEADQAVRYDVVGICGVDIDWYPNAFDHIRHGL